MKPGEPHQHDATHMTLRNPRVDISRAGLYSREEMRIVFSLKEPLDIGGRMYNGAAVELTREAALAMWREMAVKLDITI